MIQIIPKLSEKLILSKLPFNSTRILLLMINIIYKIISRQLQNVWYFIESY